MQASTLGAWAAFLTSLGATAAAYAWPDYHTFAKAVALVCGITMLIFIFVWIRSNFSLRIKIEKKFPSDERKRNNTSTSDIQISITDVQFDPNGPSEMYVDISIANRGQPTTLLDWHLEVTSKEGDVSRLNPRSVYTDRVEKTPWGSVEIDDFSKKPMITGERRYVRLIFSILGPTPKERFGRVGTRFDLSVLDVYARRATASFTLTTAT
jgi:hypothetical protein